MLQSSIFFIHSTYICFLIFSIKSLKSVSIHIMFFVFFLSASFWFGLLNEAAAAGRAFTLL